MSPLAAVSSADFHRSCDRQLSGLEAEARTTVADWQKMADAALAGSDAREAGKALELAGSLTANVAGYSGGIFVKCLGESTYRSYLDTRRRLFQLQARHDPASTHFVIQAALFDALHNPGEDADSVLASISVEARPYRTAMNTCEGNLRLVETHRENGAFILPEEEALMRMCKKVIAKVKTEAEQQVRTALAGEDTEFNRPASEQEKEAAANVIGAGDVAQAMTGVKANTISPQVITLNRQVSNSREWLSKASAWELGRGGKPRAFTRAEERGDALLARANDKTQDLAFRDKLYGYAQRYYELCNCDDKAAMAESAHDAIQPALAAQQERQRQRLEQVQTEMKRKAEAMKKATDSMKKTETEKQEFKKEADALEEELGF